MIPILVGGREGGGGGGGKEKKKASNPSCVVVEGEREKVVADRASLPVGNCSCKCRTYITVGALVKKKFEECPKVPSIPSAGGNP